jgi:hypothetical protein
MDRFKFGIWEYRVGRLLRIRGAPVAVLTMTMALLLVPASASATSPVLEFVVPGSHFPVAFTTESESVTAEMANFANVVHCEASHGEGEITGPRSTVSEYTLTGCKTESPSNEKCRSAGAEEEEIRTGLIEADLVYIDQAKLEVAMLLNPDGGIYIAFECGHESATGSGPFLARVGPINTEANVFEATLSQTDSMQTPSEYEGPDGETLPAVPMGEHGGGELVTTGVEAMFTVHSSVSGYIKAVSSEEIEAKKHAEEAATKKRQEEEEIAAKKRLEEEAAAARKHQEAEAAASHEREEQVAAVKRLAAQTLATLRGAIDRALAPSGAPAKIRALLKHGGLTETFTAPGAGALVIRWWWLPPGAHLAKRSKRDAQRSKTPVLVAQGSASFSAAGAAKVKISLTGAGRRLLASAKELKLTASVRFTPTAQPPTSMTRIVSLKR